MLRKTSLFLICVIITLYVLNAAVFFFAQPVSMQFNATVREEKKIGNISIMAVDDLKSGGVGLWSRDTPGYVNILDSKPVIYLSSEKAAKPLTQLDYLYQHEYAHILQKELIAHYAGGYPSYWNPIQSAKYYYYLHKLNEDLSKLMPEVTNAEAAFLPGLESAAECYAQPYSDKENPEYYHAPYIYPNYCTAEQKRIIIKFVSQTWPEPLSDAEKEDLKETSIYVDLPGKQGKGE